MGKNRDKIILAVIILVIVLIAGYMLWNTKEKLLLSSQRHIKNVPKGVSSPRKSKVQGEVNEQIYSGYLDDVEEATIGDIELRGRGHQDDQFLTGFGVGEGGYGSGRFLSETMNVASGY